MSLTVACLWVRGHRKFGVEYVVKLKSMVERHLERPFRMVCLTDRPNDLPKGVEPVVVPTTGSLYQAWWSKLRMFDPAMPFDGRVLYSDLDVLVTGPLDEAVDFPAEFAIAPDSAPMFLGHGRQKVIKRYNSSLMVWNHGARADLWSKWRPGATADLWSDQDFIAQHRPDEAMFPAQWFRRVSAGPPPWPKETKVVLCIKPKNHLAVKQYDWFNEYWQ